MLDSVVELLARTNALATGRTQPSREEMGGMFAALQAVHTEYVAVFGMIRRAIVAGEPVREIAHTLALRRHEEDCERTALLAHMRLVASDAVGCEIHPWLHAVCGYFVAAPLSGQGHAAEALRQVIEQAQEGNDDTLHARAEIASATHAASRCLQRRWEVLCQEHAKLAGPDRLPDPDGPSSRSPPAPLGAVRTAQGATPTAWKPRAELVS